ncbi:MAG: hypothetical protein WCS01_13015, partial [bacterium]
SQTVGEAVGILHLTFLDPATAFQNAVVDFDSPAPGIEPSARCGARAAERSKEIEPMKRVIEKLMNHLGLPGDASEDVILEKMQGLPGLNPMLWITGCRACRPARGSWA